MSNNANYTGLLAEVAALATSATSAPIAWETIPAKMAVYLLTNEADQPLLLATVGNLRAALQRRLALDPAEAKTRRVDYGKIAKSVHFRIVHSRFAANLWYYRAAAQLFPQTYQEIISWRPAWWVSIDPAAAFPHFRRTQDLSDDALEYIGPIYEKNAAGKLIETLEDLFDLCRYYNILVQAPLGRACAYKEMGKCPAPCDGSVSMEHYRGQIRAAQQFLAGDDAARSIWRQMHEAQMRAAAADQQFELAAKIKAKLERGSLLEHPTYKFTRNVGQFRFLALQPGKGRAHVEPFFIHGGNIEAGTPVHKKDIPITAVEWLARVVALRSQPVAPPLLKPAVEHMGLVVHHLMRGNDDAGIYLPMDQIADAPTIATAAQELINRRTPPKAMSDQSSEAKEAAPPSVATDPDKIL